MKEQENNSTVSSCQWGQGSKSPWAENKLAALPAPSRPSERRLLFTPALQTVLLIDNTFKDIKMFPSAYRLSPYWLYWQNCVKSTQQASSGPSEGLHTMEGGNRTREGRSLGHGLRISFSSLFIRLFIHSYNSLLVAAHVLGTRDISVNQTDESASESDITVIVTIMFYSLYTL